VQHRTRPIRQTVLMLALATLAIMVSLLRSSLPQRTGFSRPNMASNIKILEDDSDQQIPLRVKRVAANRAKHGDVRPAVAITNDELELLIDQLMDISEPGVGYSAYFSGSGFLPYSESEQLGTFVLGRTYSTQSDTLLRIVANGCDSIPTLLKHISDDRKINSKPQQGTMWTDFPDEYDFNRRTRGAAPTGVNGDEFGKEVDHPGSHSLTVGDLCFVAIGQIVNRSFNATRYQSTGGLLVNSPTYSRRLHDVLLDEWKDLTPDRHKQLLIDDFEQPDSDGRRIGAYLRLCFYYPDAVEPLVLKVLDEPTYDNLKIWDFCRESLYVAQPEARQSLFEAFLRDHGDQYADGVMQQFFEDLKTLEACETIGIRPQLTEFSNQPRELLIQLFGKPPSVKSSECPAPSNMTDVELARLIDSLTHDNSQRIGDVVKRIYLQHADEDYLAPACLKCLANRGYDDFLLSQLERIDYSTSEVNYLHSETIKAIATSDSPIVGDRLRQVVSETRNETYFLHALSGLDVVDDEVVWINVCRILKTLPDDATNGKDLLEMVTVEFPSAAEKTLKLFLSKGSATRANTVCEVLWYSDPMSPGILAPLLDDRRELTGFTTPIRVCDRAAEAISHTAKGIEFDSDWSLQRRDAAILVLKKYCANYQSSVSTAIEPRPD
jgi:hypothetical protein